MRKNNKGFTLIEMLIVVAIIAILIAVSIPLVQSSLERARVATDAANERACKAELLLCYLNGYIDGNDGTKFVIDTTTTGATAPAQGAGLYYYDAVDGKLVATAPTTTPHFSYGKCTGTLKHSGGYLQGWVTADGEAHMQWNEVTSGAGAGAGAGASSTVQSGTHGIEVKTS